MNGFGRNFRINIFGESHGTLIGICIDGCPPGISIYESDFITDIKRRKSGIEGTTPRIESDIPQIVSGVFNNYTTGAPITIIFKNENTISKDYTQSIAHWRPSHTDFVAKEKFNGYNDYRGGGHFSGRITLPLVAAGVIAKKIIKNIKIRAELITVKGCSNIKETVAKAIADGDSIGGIVECTASNIPIGMGEPFFNSGESQIAHLAFSIPAVRGIEFGAGFAAATMYGSEHNDPINNAKGETNTNNAGGIVGGITNGNNLVFRIAVKPTSSIKKTQETFNIEKNIISPLKIKGRHDSCIALRVPVIIEAITAIVLSDFSLENKS